MNDWKLFPHMVVRTTGFPFEQLTSLRYRRSADAARRLAWEEAAFAEYRNRAPRVSRPPKQVLSHLKALRPVPLEGLEDPAVFIEWNKHAIAMEQARAAFEEAFKEEREEAEKNLRKLVADERLLESIASSSPPIYMDLVRGRWSNRVERQVGSYLQRLSAKNETMSFFGPINYGALDFTADGADVSFTWSGAEKLTGRRTHLAAWIVQGISRRVAFDPGIAPWLVLRRKGFSEAPQRKQRRERLGDILLRLGALSADQVRDILASQSTVEVRFGDLAVERGWCSREVVERGLAIQAGAAPLPSEPPDPRAVQHEDILPRLVAAADGSLTLARLAETLSLEYATALKFAQIGCERGLLTHQLEIPAATGRPLDELIERLAGIPGDRARHHLGLLDRIVELKGRYSQAPAADKVRFNEELRQWTLEHWDVQLQAATQSGPNGPPQQRGEGHNFYADRLPLREECGGDLRLNVSGDRARELLDESKPALELMARAAIATREASRSAIAQLIGVRTLPFWKIVAAFSDRPIPFDPTVTAAIAAQIVDPTRAEISIDVQKLALTPVTNALPLVTSIDLLIGAKDAQAWKRGEYELVLGDVHDTALVWGWALQFHEERDRVEAEMLRALGGLARPIPIVTALASRRTGLLPAEFPGPVIELGGVSAKSAAWRLPFDDLDVVSDGVTARLMSRSLGSEVCLYNGELESLVHTAFSLPRMRPLRIDLGDHTPCIKIGKAVVQRQQWRMRPEHISGLLEARDDVQRMRAAVKVWDELSLPEYVFAKFKNERKPILVDPRSPLLLRVFINLLDQRGDVTLSEMRPGPAELWLENDRQQHHTVELRCTFLAGGRGA